MTKLCKYPIFAVKLFYTGWHDQNQAVSRRQMAQKIVNWVEKDLTQCRINDRQKNFFYRAGFAVGYKKGYCHRSDKAYNKAMFNYWKRCVIEEDNMSYGYREFDDTIKIVEPEKIIEPTKIVK